jgi:inosose dehydratase
MAVHRAQINMKMETLNRRNFLKAGIITSVALAPQWVASTASADVTKPNRDWLHGLKLGLASYTLHKFNLDEAIAAAKDAGVKYITLKDVHLPLKSTPEQLAEARRKIEAAGLTLMGGGVIYLANNESQIRQAFEYAKGAGMPTIVSSPDLDALDAVEKAAKEYRIKVAIHNHGPGDKHYPSPLDVWRLIENRDPLMGICIDVGHTVRLGQDPVEVIGKCASRLYDFHIKDVTGAVAKASPTELGRGVIDIPAVLRKLIDVKFSGHLALEYEAHADAPIPGMRESFGYIRGALTGL